MRKLRTQAHKIKFNDLVKLIKEKSEKPDNPISNYYSHYSK